MRLLRFKHQGWNHHRMAKSVLALITLCSAVYPLCAHEREDEERMPLLPSPLCDRIQVPTGNELVMHVYALGYQIYEWNGTKWVFVAPDATLFADSRYHRKVGTHFAGPTWRSNSGSEVVGKRLMDCSPDANSIPWLLLGALSSHGPGVFDGVSFIQRVNTTGGMAPGTAGSVAGERAAVPYSAEYFFYKPDLESGDEGA